MNTTTYPHYWLTRHWMIGALTLFLCVALAQEAPPVDCSGDDFVEGVNHALTDDGAGMAFALGGGAAGWLMVLLLGAAVLRSRQSARPRSY